MSHYIQAPFVQRNNIPYYLNEVGLTGKAVEVGTHRGDYAKIILDNWTGKLLYAVDPWCNPPGYETQVQFLWGDGDREKDFEDCKELLVNHKDRVKYIRELSSVAVRTFKPESLDFVYIDGDHRREEVYKDICNWWECVKKGGILAGHDIICPGNIPDDWGVEIQWAVNKFSREHDLLVHIIPEINGPWSYFMIKE